MTTYRNEPDGDRSSPFFGRIQRQHVSSQVRKRELLNALKAQEPDGEKPEGRDPE
jgi:hypothetical protein